MMPFGMSGPQWLTTGRVIVWGTVVCILAFVAWYWRHAWTLERAEQQVAFRPVR